MQKHLKWLVIFGLSKLKISISKDHNCLPLMSDVTWSFVSLYKVKSWVRSCSIGRFLRSKSAGI